MKDRIIKIEPTTIEDYKQIVTDRSGQPVADMSLVYLLQDYKKQHGSLKGLNFDKVLEIMLEDRL
jgi:hypothetical protein